MPIDPRLESEARPISGTVPVEPYNARGTGQLYDDKWEHEKTKTLSAARTAVSGHIVEIRKQLKDGMLDWYVKSNAATDCLAAAVEFVQRDRHDEDARVRTNAAKLAVKVAELAELLTRGEGPGDGARAGGDTYNVLQIGAVEGGDARREAALARLNEITKGSADG